MNSCFRVWASCHSQWGPVTDSKWELWSGVLLQRLTLVVEWRVGLREERLETEWRPLWSSRQIETMAWTSKRKSSADMSRECLVTCCMLELLVMFCLCSWNNWMYGNIICWVGEHGRKSRLVKERECIKLYCASFEEAGRHMVLELRRGTCLGWDLGTLYLLGAKILSAWSKRISTVEGWSESRKWKVNGMML